MHSNELISTWVLLFLLTYCFLIYNFLVYLNVFRSLKVGFAIVFFFTWLSIRSKMSQILLTWNYLDLLHYPILWKYVRSSFYIVITAYKANYGLHLCCCNCLWYDLFLFQMVSISIMPFKLVSDVSLRYASRYIVFSFPE